MGAAHLLTAGSAILASNKFQNGKMSPLISGNFFLLPVAVAVLTCFFLVLPAYIALIRTEASLLPEDMSAIVPFDRTFGGRMGAQEVGPKGCALFKSLTLRGAYMQFGRETYRRVAKMQVKFLAVTMAITFAFAAAFATEIFVISGGKKNIREFIKYAKDNMA